MMLSGLKWRGHDPSHPDIRAEAFYDGDTREYVVIVRRGDEQRERRFLALYDPGWGVDIVDLERIKRLAGKLVDEITGEKGENHD